MIPADTATLLQAAQAGDQAAAQRLVEANQGLVWSVVRRYLPSGQDREDLYQLGCLGLLKAIQGFDLAFGTQFSTYAVPKIAGEIRRFLRDDGLVKVSRGQKEQAQAICRARDRLTAQLGREPTLSELAQDTGLTPEDIAAADLATASVASLQAESGESGLALEGMVASPEEDLVERVALRTAIGRLPERQRMLILLRYYRGLTQDRTAKILGVSQVQVSRLEKKALQFLRQELRED
ncbi:MAG TPA: sigma-70 family RNA polymerase sigma factor [Candidatus Evtepia faecavium]|nr:sigma-70 family RNA polymerase sigma factor [Candidatus Evtepia faecavium]